MTVGAWIERCVEQFAGKKYRYSGMLNQANSCLPECLCLLLNKKNLKPLPERQRTYMTLLWRGQCIIYSLNASSSFPGRMRRRRSENRGYCPLFSGSIWSGRLFSFCRPVYPSSLQSSWFLSRSWDYSPFASSSEKVIARGVIILRMCNFRFDNFLCQYI